MICDFPWENFIENPLVKVAGPTRRGQLEKDDS